MVDFSLQAEQLAVIIVGESGPDLEMKHLCHAFGIPIWSYPSQEAYFKSISNEATKSLNRSQIVILGGPIETDLTQISLAAMVKGYQLFVLVDRITSTSSSSLTPSLERLYQYGASPILWVQMQHEIRMPQGGAQNG